MQGNKKGNDNEYYILETGRAGQWRLNLLHEVYGEETEKLLTGIGLKPGMHVADIGCGPGVVTCFMAGHIGGNGLAVGIDSDTEQLKVAREESAAKGLHNIRFVKENVYSLGVGPDSFDLVYARSLISHLQQPLEAIKEMRRIIKPGGVLVCEDIDMTSIYSEPQTKEYLRMVEIFEALGKSRSTDYNVGSHLPDLLRRAGFKELHVSSHQPKFGSGERKRYWEYTLYELKKTLINPGIISLEEFDSLAAGLKKIGTDDNYMVAQALQTQVWARK
jgi:ubiquinone/menaquinone biosynthesis C-methylase UbiE